MTKISVSNDVLTVDVERLHQLWALKRRIRVPLSHVRGATADPGFVHEPKGVRAPGLHIPGAAVIGTFRRDGETHFWDVSSGSRAVVIELAGEEYDRLIVEVDDPRATVEAINEAAVDDGSVELSDVEPAFPLRRPKIWEARWRVVVASAVALEAASKVAMLVDLRRRPQNELRGSKRTWGVLAFVNFFGPFAYFIVGRRSASSVALRASTGEWPGRI